MSHLLLLSNPDLNCSCSVAFLIFSASCSPQNISTVSAATPAVPYARFCHTLSIPLYGALIVFIISHSFCTLVTLSANCFSPIVCHRTPPAVYRFDLGHPYKLSICDRRYSNGSLGEAGLGR